MAKRRCAHSTGHGPGTLTWRVVQILGQVAATLRWLPSFWSALLVVQLEG